MASEIFFSSLRVTSQVFYKAELSYAIVNLKPLVPGHVIIASARAVPKLADLEENELACLMSSVNRVGKIIERVFNADSLTISCQDGKAAGQTIPHVHFHLLPRKFHGDRFSQNNDDVYPAIENAEATLASELGNEGKVSEKLRMDNEERHPRSIEDMVKEAEWLKGYFTTST